MIRLISIFVVLVLIGFPSPLFAASDQAYKDYLFSQDQYRQSFSDFSIAKNEYQKFKTLTSESAAISKTQDMLAKRSLLLRSYLLLLKEKLNEAVSMPPQDKTLYLTLIDNEIQFLETHAKFVNSIATIADATKASQQLESHYLILATSIRQIILGLNASRLQILGQRYSESLSSAQTLLQQSRSEFTLDKQLTLDRWFERMSDKRTLFLQKITAISDLKTQLKASRVEDLDTKYADILKQLSQAKQELSEGTRYTQEFLSTIKYKE